MVESFFGLRDREGAARLPYWTRLRAAATLRPMMRSLRACTTAVAIATLAATGHASNALAATTRPGARPAQAHAAVAAPSWPPGTEIVPFDLRNGLILVRATLRSPAGSVASGPLVFDTGAPGLTVDLGTWQTLQLDTTHPEGNVIWRRRPLDALEMGSLRMTQLSVAGVLPNDLLGAEVMGLFGPSLLGDRAIVVDYERRSLAIVSRSLTLMSRDTTAIPAGVDRVLWDHVQRSRARFGAILPAAAVPVPLRMFPGGRMLVDAAIEDPAAAWHSRPMALLLDTGASTCALFEDAIAERASRVPGMIRYRDVSMETVLGTSRVDVAILPRLRLLGAGRDLAEDDVEAGRTARRDLPDIAGELPAPVHGLLGYSFLRRFRPVIDYADAVLWLAPREASPMRERSHDGRGAPATSAGVGIVPMQVEGRLCIGAVVPGSPAAAAGARPGEAIESIDGVRAADLDPEAGARMLAGKPGTAVVVVVRQAGMQRVLRMSRVAAR